MTDPAPAPLRVAVLASGRGSHFVSLHEAARQGELPIELVGVYCDRADAPVLERARAAAVPVQLIEPCDHPNRAAHDAAVFDAIDAARADLIVCAGYMRILGEAVVRPRSPRMINIHPSLLPRHRGLHTHRRALAAGDTEHGASVHFVTAELDGGPVIAQARIAIAPDDDEAGLSQRVLQREHPLLRACVALFAARRIALHAECALLDGRPLRAPLLLHADNRLHSGP